MTRAEIQQVKQRFGIIGNTEALSRAIDVAIQVAPTDLSVLITGESGVGKESFPQIIHQYSRRKHGQYIAVNCGAIPEGTIDSELFGHEKGAFTGAIGERKGYFGEADGGTIFLDEVGELPMPTQARLLRVLESGEFIKVGSSKVQKTDVRIVAATNVNLTQAIAEGRFREDLYYRLNTVPIQIPPLRERGDDVLLLFRKFSADFAEKYRMPAIQLTEDAKKELLAYPWPGNVRQLKNITEQISIIETNREISAAILQNYLPAQNTQRLPALMGTRESKGFESEREILYSVLFDMRQEVAELKKMVHNLMAERAGQVGQVGQMGTVVTTPVVTAHQPSVPAIIHTMQPTVCKDDDQKGGVGKTTTTINLAASLATLEKKVLVVDADPQANASSGLGVDIKQSECTIYECIIDRANVQDAILDTEIDSLKVISSHINLVGAEIEMLNLPNREKILKEVLTPLKKEYDYILIDCSPSLGLITINALTAADSVIIPVQAEYFALEGISKLLNTIKIIKSKLNPALEIEGFLLTMYDSRLRQANQIYDEVKRHFQELVFNTVIQRNVKLSEAPSYGVPTILYDAESTGAKNHLALAKEIINRNK